VRIGQLTHRVAIQKNTPAAPDGLGEKIASWATIETVYANVRPVGATEALRGNNSSGTVSHVITTRYRADLGTSDVEFDKRYRLTYDSRTFAFRGVFDVDEAHKFVEIMADETGVESPT
jgi:SPP1 family predicted phage head-tail adaptor